MSMSMFAASSLAKCIANVGGFGNPSESGLGSCERCYPQGELIVHWVGSFDESEELPEED
jgi:hypothetical protein